MKRPVYFDYAATTPVDERVAEAMMQCLTHEGNFGNPASRSHLFGWQAEEAVENARRQVADLINADPREIVFTSGATESNNLAIKGAAKAAREAGKGDHVITLATEHKAVLDTCKQLQREGFSVTYLPVLASGLVDLDVLQKAITDNTVLVSAMQVNNETGVVQDIAAIAKLCKEQGVLVHTDSAQGVAKIAVDVKALDVDMLSLSAHKMYGPKGIGALYVRRSPAVAIEEQMSGGGHERGMRSGTLAPHQIVGLGKACEIANAELADESARLRLLRDRLLGALLAMPGVSLNGDADHRVPGTLNIAFGGIEGETMMMALKDMAISSGSACTSASVDPSFVLVAMGLDAKLAHSSLRISIGRYTTEANVEAAIAQIEHAVSALKA